MLAVCCRSVSPPVEWRRRYGDGGSRLSSWLAVSVYGWVVEVVAMVMMICAFLFAPLFALFARGAASLTPTIVAYDSCVFVCVRAFAPYLPPYLPGLGTNASTGVCDGQAVTLDLDHHDYDDLQWVQWVVRMHG